MKNLFFALAFMLVGSFGFANSDFQTEKFELTLDQVLVYETNCGETAILHFTGDQVTFSEVVDMMNNAEEWLCE